jgi:hypothetical protein
MVEHTSVTCGDSSLPHSGKYYNYRQVFLPAFTREMRASSHQKFAHLKLRLKNRSRPSIRNMWTNNAGDGRRTLTGSDNSGGAGLVGS